GGVGDPSTYGGATDTGDVTYTFYNPPGVANNSNRHVQFRFIIGPGTGRAIVQIKMVRISDTTLIAGGAITADKVNVTSLSALSANMGSITAGLMNIGNRFIVNADGTCVIRSATTGARLVITQSLIEVFDAANTRRVRLGLW